MRYDSEHKAKTRDRVLKEASAAIRTQGAERVSVSAIMGRAGLTHGGFYAHFESKDELISEAVSYMFEERYSYFLSHLDTPDPRDAINGFVDSYLSMRHSAAIDRGCPIPILAGDMPRLPQPARERFVLAVDRLTDGLAKLLERIGVENPSTAASSALAEMVGALALSRVHGEVRAEQVLASSRDAIKAGLTSV
ncbi:TetR/AcrR family transcriptional regulator [Sphingomonas albertensis]|uniref:TetR/AcrR family transcriptional regulator n=1 Tax=Sphingomonas albertensis TaxID=2762591 RepID=A0ABR7AJJ1_9SPHN|nr:TetR/AcrR family transcriptional regulator [Sphingomonas albertensis]MBC3940616.1 TetR/AcrR family transcriptional regulator [Sphingomonas albertensis]